MLIRCLHAEKVKFIHAITDGTYMIALEALERLGPELGMRLVVPRHEAAAAHACDAYTRVTGEPAVVMACAGPGAANLLSGILCAQAEGSRSSPSPPPAAATSPTPICTRAAMQVSHHLDAFRPAVKWNGKVDHRHRIPEMVRHAFRVATSGRPGPVHLLIPEDILAAKGEQAPADLWAPQTYPPDGGAAGRSRAGRPGGRDPCRRRAGQRPLRQRRRKRPAPAMGCKQLAEHLGCPVTMTMRARGIVSDEHPLVFHPTCMSRLAANSQADVILAVGHPSGRAEHVGPAAHVRRDPATQKLIQVDTELTHVGLNRPADVALIGDARKVLTQLLEAVKALTASAPRMRRWPNTGCFRTTGSRNWSDGYGRHAAPPHAHRPDPRRCATRSFRPDAIMVMDGGNTTLWSIHYHLARSQRFVIYSMNYGHLGTGLPSPWGPSSRARTAGLLCVTGDSAFGFNLQELETAVRNRLPVVVIVAVDGAFGMEKAPSGGSSAVRPTWFCHDHAPVRYDQVAVAMGCHGEFVERGIDLQPALERAVASGKPSVIHAQVDPEANVDPPGLWLWEAARTGKM